VSTIAITGASGFVGRQLAANLRARGDRVVALVRPPRTPGTDELHWDPQSESIDAAGLEGVDAVVHLAGENIAGGRWTEGQKQRIRESRTLSTALLARSIVSLKKKPRVWVSASAVGIYGARGDETLDERSAPGRDFLAEVGQAWEAATAPAEAAGVRVVHARLGVVLDPEGGALQRMLPPFRLGAGARLGSGAQWMSWIARRDVLAALVFALDHDALRGPVNVTAPTPVTNRQFTEELAKALHRPAFLAIPSFAARAIFGEMADAALLGSCRVLPARLLAAGFRFEYESLARYFAAAFPA
jgi:uncharacterized protein (TIGR01777 family)